MSSDSDESAKETSTSSEDSISSSESEAEKKTVKQKGKKKTPSASRKTSKISDKDDDEVEQLVDQLSKMKVSDADYARIYYRAIKKDATVANIVAAPMKSNTLPYTQIRTRMSPPNPSRETSELFCFGCGEHDHMIW